MRPRPLCENFPIHAWIKIVELRKNIHFLGFFFFFKVFWLQKLSLLDNSHWVTFWKNDTFSMFFQYYKTLSFCCHLETDTFRYLVKNCICNIYFWCRRITKMVESKSKKLAHSWVVLQICVVFSISRYRWMLFSIRIVRYCSTKV